MHQGSRNEKKNELALLYPSHENYFSLVYVHMEPAFAQFLLERKIVFVFLNFFSLILEPLN